MKTNKSDLPTILNWLKHPPVEYNIEEKDDIFKMNNLQQENLWNSLLTNLEEIVNNVLYPTKEKNVDLVQNNEENVADENEEQNDVQEKAHKFLLLLTQLACAYVEVQNPVVPESLTSLVSVMVELLAHTNIPQDVKPQIVKMTGLWLKKKIHIEESMLVEAFKYVVKQALLPGALKSDILNVWTFRGAAKIIIHHPKHMNDLRRDLLEAPVSKNFLKFKEGCNFVGYMMTLKPEFTLAIHDVIKRFLLINKTEEYAQIYYYAWNSSNPDMKKVIEKECIQFFMLKTFTLPRKSLNMITAGQNSLQILNQFHQQKHFPHVQKMLSTLYEPLLWRYLCSSNNTHRSNACEVLFDAYPLEKPGKGRQVNDVYLNQQHDAITKLLTDNCHVVRIIAIRQVCKVLSCYWEAIPAEPIHRWIKTICILANDFSSYYVRRSVFKGLPVLLSNAHATLCLEKVLPRLQKNFHDPNVQVRSAFVNMLLAVKAAKGKLKFWHIVPLEELVGRLEVENEVVGMKLVDLLFESFFNPQFDEATVILRLVHLVALNSNASLKFFYYSKKRLPMEQAVKMMLDIISFVRGYVKDKLDTAAVKQLAGPSAKKKRLFSEKDNSTVIDESLENIMEETNESSGLPASSTLSESGEEPNKIVPLDNPEISKGFLEIAGVIWHIHLKDIEKPENKALKRKIFDLYESCLNNFLQFFKSHTGLYSAVLGLCSFLPPSHLRNFSTVESSCVSQLKKMKWDNNSDKMLMFLVPLCMWGRGADVIELAREWLKETFKKADMSNGRRLSSGRRRVVNFKETTGPNPRLGLRLIDSILTIPRCKNKVFNRNSEELVQFWEYMGTVKEFIDDRLKSGECFKDPDLCDTFLEECFDLYLTLMVSLDQVIHEEQPLNCIDEFKVVIEWSSEVVLPHVPENLEENDDCEENLPEAAIPFAVKILNIVIKYATYLLPLGKIDLQLLRRLALLIKDGLSKGTRIYLVQPASTFMTYLIEYIRSYDKADRLHLFRRVVLAIMKMVLDALCEPDMDQISVKKYIQDFQTVKRTMNDILVFSHKHSVKLGESVAAMFVDSVVNIIRTPMDESIEPGDKISSLPFFAAQITSLFILRPPMCKSFGTALQKYFSNYSKTDVSYFIAALNLYYVLCHSKTKMQTNDLHNMLSICNDCYKSELIRVRSSESAAEEHILLDAGKKLTAGIKEKLLGKESVLTEMTVEKLFNELAAVEVDNPL